MQEIFIKCTNEIAENPRFHYTLDFINKHPLIQDTLHYSLQPSKIIHTSIHYGTEVSKNSWVIPCQNIFFDLQNDGIKQVFLNSYNYEDSATYSVETHKKSSTPFLINGCFQFDIFECIFYHISRYEEVFANQSDKDQSLWLTEDQHVLVKHRLEKRPIIDQLIATLVNIHTNKKLSTPTIHSLSHDIDLIYRFRPLYKIPKALLGIIWHRRGIDHFLKSIKAIFQYIVGMKKDPYDVYDWLFSYEKLEKTCYFISDGETTFENNYDINDARVEMLIQLLHERDYQIGIHPSYNAAFKKKLFTKERILLEEVYSLNITRSRQHCLRWDWQKTPYIIQENGIQKDSSMGYNRRIGFRCGTGFPYQLYDFSSDRAFEFIELPLAFMESSLIHEASQDVSSLAVIFEQFFAANLYNTHIESNWHNSNFDESMWYGPTLKSLFYQYKSVCAY